TISRGPLLIGFVRVLHDDYPADPGGEPEGIGYTSLVTSRDGISWTRHKEPFLDRSPNKGEWDHAMAWVGSVVPVGDEFYIYYGGYEQGHKIDAAKERQLGLATMPRDRFVSQRANDKTGTFSSGLMWFEEERPIALTLNAATKYNGRIGVQVRKA